MVHAQCKETIIVIWSSNRGTGDRSCGQLFDKTKVLHTHSVACGDLYIIGGLHAALVGKTFSSIPTFARPANPSFLYDHTEYFFSVPFASFGHTLFRYDVFARPEQAHWAGF